MPLWRKRLYSGLSHLMVDPIVYFNIPVKDAIEIGVPLEL